jgi:signal transduction histidine kinase
MAIPLHLQTNVRRSMSRISDKCLFLLLATLPPAFAQPLDQSTLSRESASALSGGETENGQDDEVLRTARRSYDQAGNEHEALLALAEIVNLQRRMGDYAKGLEGAREGLARAKKLGDTRLQINFLYLLGRLHWNLSDYPRSVETHLEELKLAEKLGDAALQARTHGALGATYLRFGRSKDAFTHLEKGLELVRRTEDTVQLANLLNNLGNYYISISDYDHAHETHLQALRIREKQGDMRGIADSQTNLGIIAESRGQYGVALDCFRQALEIYRSMKLRRYLANTHRRIASVLRQSGRPAEALSSLETAFQIAEPLNSPEVLAAIYQEFALTYEAKKDLSAALNYERKRAAADEAMRSERDRLRMEELRGLYVAEQRELEIALLRREQELQTAELRRQRVQNIALGSVLGLGLFIVAALAWAQRSRLKAERRLRAATDEARARAEQAERLKSKFLSMASHDLKVPLNALRMAAERIVTDADDAENVRRLAREMRSDTAHMGGLVRDFLDAAAIEDGNLQMRLARLDLTDTARVVISSLHSAAEAKQQSLVLQLPQSAPPAVLADPQRIRQVLENIVGNALKFTPPGGRIEVLLGRYEAWVFVEVRDTGPGLRPADFAKIFAPFQSLSAKPTGSEASTGLGLFIARELLTLQAGKLEVQSQPGQGATFRILLPVAPSS